MVSDIYNDYFFKEDCFYKLSFQLSIIDPLNLPNPDLVHPSDGVQKVNVRAVEHFLNAYDSLL